LVSDADTVAVDDTDDDEFPYSSDMDADIDAQFAAGRNPTRRGCTTVCTQCTRYTR
jgi:hypothetical protein